MIANNNIYWIFRIIFLLLFILPNQSFTQTALYNSNGKTIDVEYLSTRIELLGDVDSEGLGKLTKPNSFGGASLFAIGGAFIDFAFSLASDIQGRRIKKFTNEQMFHSVITNTQYGEIPTIHVERVVHNNQQLTPYKFKLIPKEVNSESKLFYYELDDFQLDLSECKLTNSHSRVNFVIELQLKVIDNKGKLSLLKSSPIILNYCSTISGQTHIEQSIRTSIFNREVTLVEVGVKILQSNATKISANDFSAALWNSGEKLGGVITTISENIETKEEENENSGENN
jgi:hypothetical protein